jgi:hypothetical protein
VNKFGWLFHARQRSVGNRRRAAQILKQVIAEEMGLSGNSMGNGNGNGDGTRDLG